MDNKNKSKSDRFLFRMLYNKKGLIRKIDLGEEQSEIIENIVLISNESNSYDLSKNDLIPICTINQMGIHSLINKNLSNNSFISELVSYIKSKSVTVYTASLWKIPNSSLLLSRIIYQDAPVKRNQVIEFIQWGFSEKFLLNWSLTIPAEQCWVYDRGGDRQIPVKIGKIVLEEFSSDFSKENNLSLKFIYKRKNRIDIYPHKDISEGSSVKVNFSPFKEIPAFKFNYSVHLDKFIEKKIIKGPMIEFFDIPRGSSRICFVSDETDWVSVVGSISCIKHYTDWKFEYFQRFTRFQEQTFTPFLFFKNLDRNIIDFVFQEYRIKHIFTINSIPKILKSDEYLKKNQVIIPLTTEIPSQRLFDLNQQLIKNQLELPQYNLKIFRFDCLIIFPENEKLLLYSTPFIRYLNAIPMIISDELEHQFGFYHKFLKTNIVIGIGLDNEMIKEINQVKNFRFIENINGDNLVDVILNVQKVLFSFQLLDFILKEFYYIFLEIPEVFTNSLKEISDYIPDSLIERLFLPKNLDETEFIKESLIKGHTMDIVTFQKLLKIHYDLYNKVLVERGVKDFTEVNFSNIEIVNQHIALISHTLNTPQLINAVFYAVSKKLYVLPLNSPNRKIKKRLRKMLEDVHKFMSQTPVSRKLEYISFLDKMKNYNKLASHHVLSKKLSNFLFLTCNFPNNESEPLRFFKFISLFPDEVNLLYEKVGTNPLEQFFAIGRVIGKSWKDTNRIVLRNIVNSYLPQKKPFLFFSTSLVDKEYDKKIHNLNQSCINALGKYSIGGYSTNTFENYRDFLNNIRNCTHFFYWGHGTSGELNLEDEDHPQFPIPISIKTLEELSNPDGKLCVLTSCEGGNLIDPNQLNLAQTFQKIGFNSIIASFTFLPIEGGTNLHVNLLMNLFEEITIGELLNIFKSNRSVYFSEFFILFGDPTIKFSRLFMHERKNIRYALDKKIKENFPLTKRDKFPM